jgi:hypothetical protein
MVGGYYQGFWGKYSITNFMVEVNTEALRINLLVTKHVTVTRKTKFFALKTLFLYFTANFSIPAAKITSTFLRNVGTHVQDQQSVPKARCWQKGVKAKF